MAFRILGRFDGEAKLAVVFFVLLALIPATGGGYTTYILPQYMCFGILAMSLALLWGFTGILSFGQAGFFAIGGYLMGLVLSGTFPFGGFFIGLLMAAGLGYIVAALLGYFLFSAGVRDAYFVIVTLALSIIVEQIAVSQSQLTGGWNGMFVMRPEVDLGVVKLNLYGDVPAFYTVLAIVALVYVLLHLYTRSRFGKILVGIRENEARLMSLGINTAWKKTLAFGLSGAVAAFAGALYAMHSGFVSPSLGGVLFSTEVVVWVAIAGRTSLLGALLGGIAVSWLSSIISAWTPAYWQLFVGLIFIITIAFFRDGVAGAIGKISRKRRSKT
jgi:urea transport system permease protein